MDPNRITHPNWITFIAGLSVALTAAGLLVLGIIESGPAAAVGIVGIGLIGASARGRTHPFLTRPGRWPSRPVR